jgi:hypothetical protein
MFQQASGGGARRSPAVVVVALLGVVSVLALISAVVTSSASNASSKQALRRAQIDAVPAWMRTEPALAGRWIHWQEREYHFFGSSPDPANGQLLVADIWEQIGANGIPTLAHVWFTFTDGRLHQEVYQDRHTSIIVYGSDYKAVYPAQIPLPQNWCVTHWHVNPSSLPKLTPEFADESKLPAAGFRVAQGAPTRPLPDTPQLSSPHTKVYPAPANLHVWKIQRHDAASSTSSATIINVDAAGRVVYDEWLSTDAKGGVVLDTWVASGPLYVYANAAAIPSTVAAVPQAVPGGCA